MKDIKLLYFASANSNEPATRAERIYTNDSKGYQMIKDLSTHINPTVDEVTIVDITSLGTVIPGRLFHIGDGMCINSGLTKMYDASLCTWSEDMDRYILSEYAWINGNDNSSYATHGWWREHGHYPVSPDYGGEDRTVWDSDDLCYCDDIDSYAFCDDTHYDEQGDRSVYYEENMSRFEDGCINGYHATSGNTRRIEPSSLLQIGFEIEKPYFNTPHGDTAEEQGDYVDDDESLFRGYEYDASCGVEAITHIMPLDKEYHDDMIALINRPNHVTIIDTPLGERPNRCGGHITFSHKEMDSNELFVAVKPNLALCYAIWKKRLHNNYCNGNKKLNYGHNRTSGRPLLSPRYGGAWELRLPSGVVDTKDLVFRYMLIWHILDHSLNGDGFFSTLLERVKTLLKNQFGDKAIGIIADAVDFHQFLMTDECPESVVSYVSEEVSRDQRQRIIDTESMEIATRLQARTRRRTLHIGDRVSVRLSNGSTRNVTLSSRGFVYNYGRYIVPIPPSDCNAFTIVTRDGYPITWRLNEHTNRPMYSVYCLDTEANRYPRYITADSTYRWTQYNTSSTQGILIINNQYYSWHEDDVVEIRRGVERFRGVYNGTRLVFNRINREACV